MRTLIHLGAVMKVLGERKTFIQNHPDFLEYFLRIFGGEPEAGTVVEVRVIKPGRKTGMASELQDVKPGQVEVGCVKLEESDMELFRGVRDLVREIVKE